MNSKTTTMSRSKTPTHTRLITTARNIGLERSVTPNRVRKSTSDLSVSPIRRSMNTGSLMLKQEVVDLAKFERQLKQKAQQLKLDSDALKDKYQRTIKDLALKEKKLESDKQQIIDLFTNFIVNKNILVNFSSAKKSKATASPLRTSTAKKDSKSVFLRDTSPSKMKSIFLKNKKTPEVVKQSYSSIDNGPDISKDFDRVLKVLKVEMKGNKQSVLSSNQKLLLYEVQTQF